MLVFRAPLAFEWDGGNKGKNLKHTVTDAECEEIFFDHGKKMLQDALHSGREARYILIGKTKNKRRIFIAFTIRNNKIRIISARDLNRKERRLYEEDNKSAEI